MMSPYQRPWSGWSSAVPTSAMCVLPSEAESFGCGGAIVKPGNAYGMMSASDRSKSWQRS